MCGRADRRTRDIADEDIVAIVPLMHRHEVEPQDAASFTTLRRPADGTPCRPDATAIFMAASYHADYATILCHPDDLRGGLRGGRGVARGPRPDVRALGRHRPAPAAGRRSGTAGARGGIPVGPCATGP